MTAGPAEAGRRASAAVILAFAVVSLWFTGAFPPWANPNEVSRFETVVAMAEFKTLSIDRAVALLGDHEDKAESNGRFYSNKAPGLAFAAYPVYRLLRLALPPPWEGSPVATLYLLRLLAVTAVCVVALRRFARRLEEGASHPSAPALVTAAVAFGTPFLFYGRSFFAHAFSAALLFLAWDRLRKTATVDGAPIGAALAGLVAGWAAISEYTVAPLVGLLALRAAMGPGRRKLAVLAAFVAGAAIPFALLLWYDAACFGSPWILSSAREADPAYATLASRGLFGIGAPDARVALDYLAHPARGALLYSPFLLWFFGGVVAWWRSGRDRADCLLAAAAVAVGFLAMTGYPNWHGGWSLGDRYLVPLVFFAAAPIGRALATPLSRGLFVLCAVFAIAMHFLLTASFPHFPLEAEWPASAASLWFLARGWAAQSVGTVFGLSPVASLAIPFAATLLAAVPAIRAARPTVPAASVSALAGAAAFLLVVALAPEPPYAGRLWRAGMLGAFSGRDPARAELSAAVAEAQTPQERRRAAVAWRMWGPR
ncbi:MAG TPA: hypothetical protein VH854_09070 [Thermoanaerobaculia bacterium]|nr:hypothetical protein [Thermoanaerobaculia bacterium]